MLEYLLPEGQRQVLYMSRTEGTVVPEDLSSSVLACGYMLFSLAVGYEVRLRSTVLSGQIPACVSF